MTTQGKKALRKKNKAFTMDEKLLVLKFWDNNDNNTKKTLANFNISRTTFQGYKKNHWEDYLRMDQAGIETLSQADAEKEVSIIKAATDIKLETQVRRKASSAAGIIIDLILFKLEREKKLMTDKPETYGSSRIGELAKLLDVALSYVLPKAQSGADDGPIGNLSSKHARFTKIIQNQFNITNNGKEETNPGGDQSWITVTDVDEQGQPINKHEIPERGMETSAGENKTI